MKVQHKLILSAPTRKRGDMVVVLGTIGFTTNPYANKKTTIAPCPTLDGTLNMAVNFFLAYSFKVVI